MSTTVVGNNKVILELLNGTLSSFQSVVPVNFEITKPQLHESSLHLQFGVLIGVTGDIKGKLVFSGDLNLFSYIGEAMYGMSLEGEMLTSFSGELGNMIAGGLSTNVVESGINIDITSPTIMQGNTLLSGYKKAISLKFLNKDAGDMDIYLLLG